MKNMLATRDKDKDAPVALCAWDKGNGIREAITLCDGFQDLDTNMKVLIKPNLVVWIDTYPYAPFGVITMSVVIEEVIKVLKDFGVKDITVGDGGARNKEFGSETHILFDRLGYDLWTKKYGIKLVDFNEGEHESVKLGPFTLKVSRSLIECDYLLNLPALKTHELTRVTLGFKNLKGCLHPKTKQSCHNPEHSVDEYLFHIANRFYPDLTIIDGIYMLEKGPMFTGTAHRAELIVAGRDMFSVDVVGASLMGVDPSTVLHLKLFAESHDRSLNVKDIEVRGLELEDHVRSLDIDNPWSEDGRVPESFVKQNLQGFDLPFPHGVCTGCTYVFPPTMLLILSANKGVPFDNYELLAGKGARPSGKANKTFLLGNCPIKEHRKNEKIREAVLIPGCPPKISDIIETFKEHGVEVNPASVDRFFFFFLRRKEKENFPKEEYWLR